MLHLLTQPIGYDINIQKLQVLLYNTLANKWDLGETNFEGFGRAYKVKTNKGITPYVLDSNTDKDYRYCGWDDRASWSFFFGISDEVEHTLSAGSNIEVHLCMFVNLSKIDFDNTKRRDYEVRKDVYDIVSRGLYGLNLKSEGIGVERTLAEYDALRTDDAFARFDTHPLHCFRYNFNLNYRIFKNP